MLLLCSKMLLLLSNFAVESTAIRTITIVVQNILHIVTGVKSFLRKVVIQFISP